MCINSAIFTHDSAWATAGVGKKANNPCNMRVSGDHSPIAQAVFHSPGNGSFASFATLQDGIRACVDLYARLYSGKSPETIVNVWAHTKSQAYHAAVASCF